jgi:hypothetical protein
MDLMYLVGYSVNRNARNLVRALWNSDKIKNKGRETFKSEQDLEKIELKD